MEKNPFELLRNTKINAVSKVKLFLLSYSKYNKNKITNRYGFLNCMFSNPPEKKHHLHITFQVQVRSIYKQNFRRCASY